MFFQFTPDHDTLRRMQEEAARKAAESSATGPKIYQTSDGRVVIDDPSLIGEVKVLNETPSRESLELTSMWIPNVVSPDGTLGAWVPLARLQEWQTQGASADAGQ